VSRSSGIVDQQSAVSEHAFPDAHGAEQATVRQVRRMRDRVAPRQMWTTKRRRDGQQVRIRSVHRKERRVDVIDAAGQRFQLTFSELRRYWRQADEASVA
jgi:hypothetical protein